MRHHQTREPKRVAVADTQEAAFAMPSPSTHRAFGGIIALNRTLEASTVQALDKLFVEVIVTHPKRVMRRLNSLSAKKNLQLLLTGVMPDPVEAGQMIKQVAGGFLGARTR